MQALKNKKKTIIVVVLIVILAVLAVFWILLSKNEKDGVKEPTVSKTSSDLYIRNSSGEIQKQLIVNTGKYNFVMDLYGPWKEYLGDMDDRDNYQAVLSPDKNSWLYIKINSKKLDKNSIMDSIRKKFKTVEFDSVREEDNKCTFIYLTSDENKSIMKNYTVSLNDNSGYQIVYSYSAPNISYSENKGYIDDMIKSSKIKALQ